MSNTHLRFMQGIGTPQAKQQDEKYSHKFSILSFFLRNSQIDIGALLCRFSDA